MRLLALLSDAVSYAGRLAPLAAVPFVASLARWRDVVSTATESGYDFGIKFGFPHPLADLWTFVDPPTGDGLTIETPAFVDGSLAVNVTATVFVAVFVGGLLMAGYLGSIEQYVESGRYDFLQNVATYGLAMVGYQCLVFVGAAGFLLPAVVSPLLFVAALPFLVVVAYLLYPTPYLVVSKDLPLSHALERSVALTKEGGDPLVFFIAYALSVAGMSLPLSVLTNAGFPGVLVAAILASGVGLVLTIATVLFVRELLAKPTADPRNGAVGPDSEPGET